MINEHTARREHRSAQDTREPVEVHPLNTDGVSRGERPPTELVRLRKPVVIRQDAGSRVDGTMVNPKFYDCFNYALLSQGAADVNIAVGITSANPGEGKTLVASNLAVSLTVAYQRRTVLVDMNIREPRLHEVFDIPPGPGLLEAVSESAIQVAKTAVRDLFVLTAGMGNGGISGGLRLAIEQQEREIEASLQLEQVAAFRDVLYSLKEEFSFVIVDMPAVREHLVPLLFTNQLDGILFVVHGGQTKQGELDQGLQLLSEHRVLGFVYNGSDRGTVKRRKRAR